MKPVGMDRFIAWDDFKARTLSLNRQDRRAANRASRTLFAAALLRENHRQAREGRPLLGEYINPDYAASYESFIPPLSRLLPSLDRIGRRMEALGGEGAFRGPYFADLVTIRRRYALFLEEHRWYEPSWDRRPFDPSGDRRLCRWLLFFPELAEDWEEYEEELTRESGGEALEIIPLDRIAPPNAPEREAALAQKVREILGDTGGYIRFSDSGDEYRWLALTIRRLLDEGGLAVEDIAVSFPGPDNPERLIREFRLRDIPADPRRGQPLPKHPGGRIFSALLACPGGNWSYQSLKNLLLDRAFPWKDQAAIEALMEFGLRYRCVSGFTEEDQAVDVWERSFERLWEREEPVHLPVSMIRKFYRQLKRDILGLVNAGSFAELHTQWQIFEGHHFDRAAIKPETDKILARAVKALEELMEIEAQMAGTGDAGRGAGRGHVYPVFLSYIRDIEYVYQSGRRGIPLYDYRVAAGIAPLVHFIINMNQEDGAVIYGGGASFLREDRKDQLRIRDRDISGDFIRAYRLSGVFSRFTVSDRTFEGPAIPHRLLSELLPGPEVSAAPCPEDPYAYEEGLALGRTDVTGPGPSPYMVPSDIQRRGWKALEVLMKDLRPRLPSGAFLAEGDELRRALGERLSTKAGDEKRDPRVSPTDLNEYLGCPLAWMLRRGLGIWEKQTGIETIDQRDLGILYHRILERFFTRLRGAPFRAELLEEYKRTIIEETDAALEEARSEEGAFQESVYGMLRERICAALKDYLEADAEALGGAEVLGAEFPLRKGRPSGPALTGIADLVLKKDGGRLILRDFKTAVIPKPGELLAEEEEAAPSNVQMAAYINMLEAEGMGVVEDARFYSLDNREFRGVLSAEAARGKLPRRREDYDQEVAGVDLVLADLGESMEKGSYAVPAPGKRGNCFSCRVSSVCRLPFAGGSR
jgi:RecB family exonuclease